MNYVVITACLNSVKTIERTINSILIQKTKPRQYIFIDGGSTDGTIELLTEMKLKFKIFDIRVDIVNQKSNGGIYEAFNMGLKKITKDIDFVFILNSDDWYTSNCSELVAENFIKNKNLDILCCSSRDYYNNGKININSTKNFRFFPVLMPIVHPACFIKKTVYDSIGFFDSKFKVSGDYEFLFRCYKNKFKFHSFDEVMVNRQMGGFADSNKKIARKETYYIGKLHSNSFLFPLIFYFLRTVLNR